MLVNQGQIELKYTETKKRPGKVRTDLILQGMTLVQAYNDKSGWKIYPFQGRKDPEKMSADDAKSLVEDAEIGGPLEDWKAQRQNRHLSRHGRRRRHGGAQAEGRAQERRRELRLSRSRSFPRDSNDHRSARRAGRAGRGRDRPRRLREKSTAYSFRSRSNPAPKVRPTNKKSSSKKARPTFRSTTPSSSSQRQSREIIHSITAMRFSNFLLLASLGFVGVAAAQQAPYSSATISGLGARNIGSATMSGRVAGSPPPASPRAN